MNRCQTVGVRRTEEKAAGGRRPDSRAGADSGSAIVEFFWLGVLLLVPLIYLLLTVFAVQRSAYAVTQAAREAGRVYVRDGDPAAASYAAQVALRDQRVPADAASVHIGCARSPCFAPGNEVTVRVSASVSLPLLPDVLADAANAAVTVEGVHTATVDSFREL